MKNEILVNDEVIGERLKKWGLLDGINDEKNKEFATKKMIELCKYLYNNETNERIELCAIPTLVHIINNKMNNKYSPEALCKRLSEFVYMEDDIVICKTVASYFSNNNSKDKGLKIK